MPLWTLGAGCGQWLVRTFLGASGARVCIFSMIKRCKSVEQKTKGQSSDPRNQSGIPEVLLVRLPENRQDVVVDVIELLRITCDAAQDLLSRGDESKKSTAAAAVSHLHSQFGREFAADPLEEVMIDIASITYLHAMQSHAAHADAVARSEPQAYWAAATASTSARHASALRLLQKQRARSRSWRV